jgi:hypothetical protein
MVRPCFSRARPPWVAGVFNPQEPVMAAKTQQKQYVYFYGFGKVLGRHGMRHPAFLIIATLLSMPNWRAKQGFPVFLSYC